VRDDLLYYYERELTFLRHLGAEFAEKYPKVAGRLLLEAGKCEDPHVERLLEGFAFLAARIHLKIDDTFPEIVEALFSILYPHFLRPVPSMSVVEIHLDPEQGKLSGGWPVPKGSLLYSAPVAGIPCKFQTCYDTTVWPLEVKSASWRTPDRIQPPVGFTDAAGALRVQVECLPDVTLPMLSLETLRFYLSGEPGLTHTLIELICNNTLEIVIRDLDAPAKVVRLPASHVRQVGLEEDESVLPYPRRSFSGYRLLQEYFAFPEKFCFIDVSGFRQAAAAGIQSRFEIIFLLSQFERGERRQALEIGVSDKTFRLGCTPIVNLFPQTAEPILLEQKRHEYRIIPDARRENAMDVFSVDEVVGVASSSPDLVTYDPFYSYRHEKDRAKGKAFWHVTRRPSGWRADKGSDVFLALLDLTGNPVTPDEDTVTVRLTCTNRDLPARLPFGDEEGDFQLEEGGPVSRIVSLVKPTAPLPPPAHKGLLWRLASQLSLNYLSLVSGGKEAFQEILRLHNFSESVTGERQISGIVSLTSRPHFTRLVSENGISFARGTRVEMEFDEEQFVGAGVYTFAAVIARFLELYVSMNSFSQLVARTRQRKGVMKTWPPRSGKRILI
jgi:type VI secretion system protein ImpG